MNLGGYHTRYGYPRRWAILAQLAWLLEQRLHRGPFYRWRKAAERRGYAAGTGKPL